jgi:hypothetical protein
LRRTGGILSSFVGQHVRRPRSLSLGSPLAQPDIPLILTAQGSPNRNPESTPDSRDLSRRSVPVGRDADTGVRSIRPVRNRKIRPNATINNRRIRPNAASNGERSSATSNGGNWSNAPVTNGGRLSATSNGGNRSSATSNSGNRSSATSDGGNRSNVTVSKGRIRPNATVNQNKTVVRVQLL